MKKKLKVVKVLWHDACDSPGWFSLEPKLQEILQEPLPGPLECISVGIFVKQNKDAIWLSNMFAQDDQGRRGGGIQVIPKPWVKNIKVIHEI